MQQKHGSHVSQSMGWCFANVNGKLAEIFFEQGKDEISFYGHAYVKEEEYKTKKEKQWIKEDTAKHKFSYRKGRYKDKNDKIFRCIDLNIVKEDLIPLKDLNELLKF